MLRRWFGIGLFLGVSACDVLPKDLDVPMDAPAGDDAAVGGTNSGASDGGAASAPDSGPPSSAEGTIADLGPPTCRSATVAVDGKVQQWAYKLFASICIKQVACCGGSLWQHQTAEECTGCMIESSRSIVDGVARGVAHGGISWDENSASKCLAAAQGHATSCRGHLESAFDDDSGSCGLTARPQLDLGAACTDSFECKAGLCTNGKCQGLALGALCDDDLLEQVWNDIDGNDDTSEAATEALFNALFAWGQDYEESGLCAAGLACTFDQTANVDRCETVVTPRSRELGQSCREYEDCVSGLSCEGSTGKKICVDSCSRDSDCENGGVCDDVTDNCRAPLALGAQAECDSPRDCADGRVCRPDGDVGIITFRCLTPLGEGIACEDGRACAAGLVCRYNGLAEENVCSAPVQTGGECDPDPFDDRTLSMCAAGLVCRPDALFPYACDQPGLSGDGCSADRDCSDGLRCHEQAGDAPAVCVSPNTSGSPCSSQQHCGAGLDCRPTESGARQCLPPGKLGERCEYAYDELDDDDRPTCEGTLTCRPTQQGTDRCTPIGAEGGLCGRNDECKSGLVCRPQSLQEARAYDRGDGPGRCLNLGLPGDFCASSSDCAAYDCYQYVCGGLALGATCPLQDEDDAICAWSEAGVRVCKAGICSTGLPSQDIGWCIPDALQE